MATRFYFHGSAYVPSISPAYDAEWNKTTNTVRRLMSPSKLTSISTTSTDLEAVTTSPYDILNRQLVSKPLKAQTISGTVKGQLRCSESNEAADMCAALVIKVVSGDGGTVRGTLLSYFPSSLTSEYATSLTNRYFPPETTVNSVQVQDGDVLVIEIGTRAFNSESTSYSCSWHFLDSATVSDLPVDESTTDALCPWIEFSHDFQFQGDVRVTQNIVQVEYLEPPQLRVTQFIAQVEYTLKTDFEYTGTVTITNTPSADVVRDIIYSGQVDIAQTVAGDYYMLGLTDREYEGQVGIQMSPTADIARDYAYTGQVAITNTVASEKEAHYVVSGTVQIVNSVSSSVSVNTLEYDGLVAITMSVGSTVTVDVPSFDVISEGAEVQIAGEGIVKTTEPSRLDEVATGGVMVGGAGTVTLLRASEASTLAVTAWGGVRVGGAGIAGFQTPGEVSLQDKQVVAVGGLVVGGGGVITRTQPSVLAVSATGGVRVGHFQIPPATLVHPGQTTGPSSLSFIATGALTVTGEGVAEIINPDSLGVESVGVILRIGGVGSASVIYPVVWDFQSEGGVVIEDEEIDADGFETWVFTGTGFEPSIYSGFDFNSYCEYRQQYYAAGVDGIYLLEGDSDDGREIHTGVRLGPVNFGTNARKRLRAIHPGDCGLQTNVRVAMDNAEFYAGLENGRLAGERILSREFVVDIADFDRLAELDFTVLAQVKK